MIMNMVMNLIAGVWLKAQIISLTSGDRIGKIFEMSESSYDFHFLIPVSVT